MNERNLMTPQEASEYLCMKKSTIYKWAHMAKIPTVKLGGKLLFKRTELDRFVDAQSRPVMSSH